ncbi:hypothetical protein [Spirochaeta thermophila]|uniref:Uncharacterized protein n=1 Tax=Winmispira thermophila (strain ATCC 49972 / DSM 6192 / RI 19.B1) TaxID=665571 RepID=E0RT20_WINT6|nr:hypothetical protein [Spirochaeta thermophila]ADN02157.1 hypothetical protein STHERM_c12160 [Spirochaeta thermophila DSM 6192]
MLFKSLGRILRKRHESGVTRAGFRSGIVAGLIGGLFSLVILLNKKAFSSAYSKELNLVSSNFGMSIPLDYVWLISLILIPPFIVLLYAIIGMFLGKFLGRFKTRWVVMLIFSILVGALCGWLTDLPASRWLILTFNLIAWFVFGILFMFYMKEEREQTDTPPRD